MASTPEGRRLTEQHRQEQQRIRAQFLIEFLALWPLLDPTRLDETSPGWIRAVMAVIRLFRERSAEASAVYFLNFRAFEAPQPARIATPQLALPPGVARPTAPPAGSPRPSAPSPTRRQPARVPEPIRRQSRPAPEVIPDVPNSPVFRFDLDNRVFDPAPRRQVTVHIPNIDWGPSDRAARVSLEVTGPVNQKSKAKRGKPLKVAQAESLAEASGAASRHVLTGGRQSLLTLLQDDPQVVAWIRVTDGDPCAFCALLASRGPVFKSKTTAGFKAHDHCACTAEPVYSRQAPWAGRAAEFRRLYVQSTSGHSGTDAINAFRRAYEAQQRDARRQGAA